MDKWYIWSTVRHKNAGLTDGYESRDKAIEALIRPDTLWDYDIESYMVGQFVRRVSQPNYEVVGLPGE